LVSDSRKIPPGTPNVVRVTCAPSLSSMREL
jgi:hypothetical protein